MAREGKGRKGCTLLNIVIGIDQRCPTHSPLATCGEWSFKCGEWLYFQTFQNLDVLGKTTKNSKVFYLIYTFKTSK
jgi:hypothetical protein